MKTLALIASGLALSVGLGSPAVAQSAHKVVRGTAIGAGAGAVAGALIPGLSVGSGALIGAGTGAATTVITHKSHHRYRDRRGRHYWVDRHGYRHYN